MNHTAPSVTWKQEDVVRAAERLLFHAHRFHAEEMLDRHGFCVGFAWDGNGDLNFLRVVGKPKKEKLSKYFSFVEKKVQFLIEHPQMHAGFEGRAFGSEVPGGAIRTNRGVIISTSGLTEELDTVISLTLAGKFLGMPYGEAIVILGKCHENFSSTLHRLWDISSNK